MSNIVPELNEVLSWKSKIKSTIALLSFMGLVYFFEPWMVLFTILLMLLRNSKNTILKSYWHPKNNLQTTFSTKEDNPWICKLDTDAEHKDRLKDGAERKAKKSILGTIIHIKNVSHEVQKITEKLVQWIQRIKNILEFRVPFLSSIAVVLLIFFSLTLYFIPLRYLIMFAGVKRILRDLICPNSNSIFRLFLNFMSKVPDNEELRYYGDMKFEPLETCDSISDTITKETSKNNFKECKLPSNLQTDNTLSSSEDAHSNMSKCEIGSKEDLNCTVKCNLDTSTLNSHPVAREHEKETDVALVSGKSGFSIVHQLNHLNKEMFGIAVNISSVKKEVQCNPNPPESEPNDNPGAIFIQNRRKNSATSRGDSDEEIQHGNEILEEQSSVDFRRYLWKRNKIRNETVATPTNLSENAQDNEYVDTNLQNRTQNSLNPTELVRRRSCSIKKKRQRNNSLA